MVGRSSSRTILRGARALFAPVLALVVSCGIFSPRDSEAPEAEGRIDPLNFSAIMDSTRHAFTRLRYEDLFVDAADVYQDFNSGWYSKTQLIQRLQQIQTQYENIQVQWTAGAVWTSAGNDTMRLSGLKYYIFTDGNTGGAPADSGSSNFIVIYGREWRIGQWTDVPARTSGKSFFAP